MIAKSIAKRAIDVSLSIAATPIAVLFIVVFGIVIRLETPGSVLFRQRRIGRNRREFTIYKLRTMVENAESIGAGLYAQPNDPRFTRIGVLARRFSIDELPQLYNVFRGDMSIVGPRPMPEAIVEEYPREYDSILRVKPGLTGAAQIHGRNDLPRRERLRHDMKYAESWTVLGDLSIMIRTFYILLSGEGQRNDQGRTEVED